MTDLLSFYTDRDVVVTGCSSGMGAAVARKLLAAGAQVIGVDIKRPDWELTRFLRVDLSDQYSIHSSTTALPAEVWGLFNCAGLSGGAANPQTVLTVNFIGMREWLERTEPKIPKGGAIVAIASGAAMDYQINRERVITLVRTVGFDEATQWAQEHQTYVEERGGYAISKEAVVLYTLERCFDLGERGVRINAIAPGATETPMLEDSTRLYGEEYLKQFLRPLGRRALPEEQANVLLFLNSDWASYVNGQVIWTDGGSISRRVLSGEIIGERS
jgi:NAD(P)-dependent dehydrogenase (short-subunit alcohol dehydrogenase family)